MAWLHEAWSTLLETLFWLLGVCIAVSIGFGYAGMVTKQPWLRTRLARHIGFVLGVAMGLGGAMLVRHIQP